MEFEHVKPMDIEKRSMEIIGQELAEKGITLPADKAHIIKRVIHTTADFEYADTLTFSEHAVEKAKEALRAGATIVTDTKMAWSGINKRTLENLHGKACNFISDEDVAEAARQHGFTRSAASMDKAASLPGPLIFAIGNAPTALIRLYELIEEGKLAGIAAAEALGKLSKEEAAKAKENVWNSLDQLRTGPFGQGRHDAKEQIIEQMEEWKVKNSAC